MPIPKFDAIMLPLLRESVDGGQYSIQQLFDKLAQRFSLSEEERNTLLPSGNEEIFRNRLRWAGSIC